MSGFRQDGRKLYFQLHNETVLVVYGERIADLVHQWMKVVKARHVHTKNVVMQLNQKSKEMDALCTSSA
jgi:hypothetical protein